MVFGECGREITPGNTGSGRERGGAARMEQLRAQLQLKRGNASVIQTKWRSSVVGERFCERCSALQLIVYRLLVRLSL